MARSSSGRSVREGACSDLAGTSSGVTTQEGKPDWRLWVFDAPRKAVKFEQRLQLAKTLIEDLAHPRIRFLKHVWIENLEELEKFIEWARAHGYEGVMLRDPDGPYKEGKSTLREQWLLKIKPFVDKEGRVVGYYEEMENTNEGKRDATGKLKRSSAKAGKKPKGRLGGLLLRDLETDEPVRVGGGFTGKQRVDLWAIREQLGYGDYEFCTYSKQATGQKDKPRHPNFKAFRPKADIDKATLPATKVRKRKTAS
jgi:DNA ligase-1